MYRVFLGLAGLLLGISLRLLPQEIPRSSPDSPRKTLSISPLLLGLTQYYPGPVQFLNIYIARTWEGHIHNPIPA